jgi:hypothetical protein
MESCEQLIGRILAPGSGAMAGAAKRCAATDGDLPQLIARMMQAQPQGERSAPLMAPLAVAYSVPAQPEPGRQAAAAAVPPPLPAV